MNSMLNLLNASVGHRWEFVEPELANLLLLGSSMLPPAPNNLGASQLIARFVEPGQSGYAGAAFSIQRPLRAMPFLELLTDSEKRLRELSGDRPSALPRASRPFEFDSSADTALQSAANTKRSGEDSTELMDSPASEPSGAVPGGRHPAHAAGWFLHGLRRTGASSQAVALIDRDGIELAAVSAGRAAFASAHALPDLLVLLESSFRRAEPRSSGFWDRVIAVNPAQPLDLLSWHVGKLMAAQSGLAPWLNLDQSYRLISWPDFGTIGAERVGFKLAASLAQKSFTAGQVSATTGVPLGEVVSFLNSASLCGLLVAGVTAQPGAPASSEPDAQAGKRSMLARLRSKLGL